MPGFMCHQCGKHHNDLPMSYDFVAPAYWSASQFEQDCQIANCTKKICIVKGQYFFIKGNIEIINWGNEGDI